MSDRSGRPLIVTLGETMGLVRAEVGGFRRGHIAEIGMGGAESNVAIGVARLGGRALWAGRVGTDSLGDRIERELRGENVEVLIQRDPHHATGLMLKEWPMPGSTRVSYYRAGSAGSRVEFTAELEVAVAEAELLHLTGITPALSEGAADTVRHAIRAAKAHRTVISFDVNFRSALWSAAAAQAALASIVPDADIVFAGAEEAALLLGGDGSPAELAERIARRGPREVVIKLGEKGALALVDGVFSESAAVPVPVVDTVGAGDAFVAGYLADRVAGRAVADRLRTAVSAGAFACLAAGDWESLPTRADVQRLYASEDRVQR